MSDDSAGQRAADESNESTRWSLVEQAAGSDPGLRRAALEKLLDHYLPGLRAFLIFQMKIDARGVDDVLQDFVADKVLMRELLGAADRSRGQFGAFLRTALRNFVLDRWRREKAEKRQADRALPLIDQMAEALADRPRATPDLDAVSHGWQVLIETVSRFQSQCDRDGRRDLWDVFALRVLRPAALGTQPADLPRLARRHGLTSTAQVSSLLVTVQRRLDRVLREVLSQYSAPDQLDSEIEQLHQQLLAAGAWKEELVRIAAPSKGAEMSELTPRYELEQLSNVLQFASAEAASLQPDMLAAMVNQLLDASPEGTLIAAGTASPRSKAAGAASGPSLRDVLLGRGGRIELLIRLKESAKRRALRTDDPLPREICTWLYYASIVAAAVHHGQQISALGPEALVQGIDWLLAQSWVDGSARALFEAGRLMWSGDSTAS
jgi:DNA-directed RNA polymerase specialized sigma24 family protein